MRYMLRNNKKMEFIKQLADARKRGHKVIKIKTETKTRGSAERDAYSYKRYKKHETSVYLIYVALIEMSDKHAQTSKDTQV